MAIKGLTDRHAAFPEIGRIRKGSPKEKDAAGKTIKMGKDLTYFRVEFDEKEVVAAKVFEERYGEKPAELDVVLPFPMPEENLEAWREAYIAGGMVHRCDGERVWFARDPRTGTELVRNGEPFTPCDGHSKIAEYVDGNGEVQPMFCKPHIRLRVILPVLKRMAFLTAISYSIYDAILLSQQLMALYQVNGNLTGIPLVFRRRPQMISTPDPKSKKQVRREKWLLSIEADPAWVDLKIQAMQLASMARPEVLQLPEPAVEWGQDDDEEDEEEREAVESRVQDEETHPIGDTPTGDTEPTPQTIDAVGIEVPEPDADSLLPGAVVVSELKFPVTVGNDIASRYWYAVYSLAGLDRPAGEAILKECDGNHDAALTKLAASHIPSSDTP